MASPENVDEHELYPWRYFDKLRGYGLLRKPYLILRKEDNLKVSLTLEVEVLDSMIYYSDKLIAVKVVDGQTFTYRKAADWLQ